VFSPPQRGRARLEQVEVGVERRHDVAIVRADADTRQARHGARHLGLREEAHDADLREAAVVDLNEQTLGLLLGRGVLREAEGVEEVEGHRVGELVEGRHVARLAAAHVVRLAVLLEDVRVLAPELEEGNGEDDLPLGNLRQVVPHDLRRGANVDARERLPREADVVGMDNVAHERRHRDAAVLDLRLTQEANRRRVRVTPELAARQVERIPEAHNRVEILGLRLEAIDVHHRHAGSARGWGRERRIERERRGAEGEHGFESIASTSGHCIHCKYEWPLHPLQV